MTQHCGSSGQWKGKKTEKLVTTPQRRLNSRFNIEKQTALLAVNQLLVGFSEHACLCFLYGLVSFVALVFSWWERVVGGKHMRCSPAHSCFGTRVELCSDRSRADVHSHLLLREQPPARVLQPLKVLKLLPNILNGQLQEVPVTGQILCDRLRVQRGILQVVRKIFWNQTEREICKKKKS